MLVKKFPWEETRLQLYGHCIVYNPERKLYQMFYMAQRHSTHWPNVRVGTFAGLLVDYAIEQQAQVIVRGIRAVSDYEYELQMALMNRRLEPQVETFFLMAAEAYSYLSSRLIKEVFKLGGPINGLVPDYVEQRMREKVRG